MPPTVLSRRGLLLSSAAALGCGRRKATRFLGYCFVANEAGRSIGVVDLTTFTVRKQIPVDAAPLQVLPHPTGPKAYVLAPQAGTVYEIDAASLAIGRRARVASVAVSMQLAPRKDALWVLCRNPAALVELPLSGLRSARRIRLSSPPESFDLSVKDQAAISLPHDRTVVLASLTQASIERTIAPGQDASLVCFQPLDGKQLMIGSARERMLSIVDIPTGRTVVRLPLPLSPRHFCFDAAGGQLFLTGEGTDAVAIVFPYSSEVDQTILAGRSPGAMAVTDNYLLVANPEADGITVLDIGTRKLVAMVQVGRQPGQILITPDKQYAIVLNERSGDLAVIRIFSLAVTPTGSQRRYKSAPLFTLIPVGERPVSAAVVALT